MLNALSTTRRTQEGPASCIFGCPGCQGCDEVQHYSSCPRARRIIRLATAEPKPQFAFSDEEIRSCILGGTPRDSARRPLHCAFQHLVSSEQTWRHCRTVENGNIGAQFAQSRQHFVGRSPGDRIWLKRKQVSQTSVNR